MQINHVRKDNLEYFVIDNVYLDEEIKQIKKELNKVEKSAVLPGQNVSTAYDKNNQYLKNNKSIFLDSLYEGKREKSKILTVIRKLFNKEITEFIETKNAYYAALRFSNRDTTLVNYYYQNEQYKAHRDTTVLTAITLIGHGEFTGGEFCFPEFNESILFKENRLIIFPGCVLHEAKPIKEITKNACRISIAQFINYN